jgi:hypothetical protein
MRVQKMTFQPILSLELDTLEKYVYATYDKSPQANFAEFQGICVCRIRPKYKHDAINHQTQIDVIIHPTNDEMTRFAITQSLFFLLHSEYSILKQTSVLNAVFERIKHNNAGPLNDLLLGLQQIVTLVKHCGKNRMERQHVKTQVEALPVASHLQSINNMVDGICGQ